MLGAFSALIIITIVLSAIYIAYIVEPGDYYEAPVYQLQDSRATSIAIYTLIYSFLALLLVCIYVTIF